MERKFANRPGWKRITQRRFYCTHLDTDEFKGEIALFCMDAVREPLEVMVNDHRVRIVDAGYAWLEQFPTGQHYAVTAVFNASMQVVYWYIDICLRTGVDSENIPWMDDLYLDLAVLPSLEVQLLDADELEDALKQGEITQAECDMAWDEANHLMACIAQNNFNLLQLSETHRCILIESERIE